MRTTGSERRGRAIAFNLAATACVFGLLLFARQAWRVGLLEGMTESDTARAGGAAPETTEAAGPSCEDCHGAAGDLHRRGPHGSLRCDECHGPVGSHVAEGVRIAPMEKVRNVSRLCSRCHRRLRGRQGSGSSVGIETHLVEVGALFSDTVCFDCHGPHDPRP